MAMEQKHIRFRLDQLEDMSRDKRSRAEFVRDAVDLELALLDLSPELRERMDADPRTFPEFVHDGIELELVRLGL